jgi:hypothetical protein
MTYTTSSGKEVDLVEVIILRVPPEFRAGVTELIHERGYDKTEIGKEGIRACLAREGLLTRNKTVAHVDTVVEGNGIS